MKNKKVLIITSTYNQIISKGLQKYTLNFLRKFVWIKKTSIQVPGAFEIPSVVEKYIRKFDGVIVLGCIIKGETNNFDLISRSITDSLMYLSIKHKKPIGNGIITCFNYKQAISRRKKGEEAALAVKEVLSLNQKVTDKFS